jgi:hypothetical protein
MDMRHSEGERRRRRHEDADVKVNPMTPSALPMPAVAPAALRAARPKREIDDRRRVGEFVGNIFFGTLLRQVQASNLKGTILHGGRGEEAFGGQLALELSKRIGESAKNPLADRIYQAIRRRYGGAPGDESAPQAQPGESVLDVRSRS